MHAVLSPVPELWASGDIAHMKHIYQFLGRLLITFGVLLVVGAICTPLLADSSHRVNWGVNACAIAVGVFLIFCALHLEKSRR